MNLLGIFSLFQVKAMNHIVDMVQFIFHFLSMIDEHYPHYPMQAKVYDGQKFDVIIVGGGTAGCVVAKRLSEVPGFSVLLIEAGGDPPLTSDIPGLFPIIDNGSVDWGFQTVSNCHSSQDLKGKSIHYIDGKMLGGTSSSNYMAYVRGNKLDYEEWVKMGNKGWDWPTVLKYFKKYERLNDDKILKSESSCLHGTKGPVGITRANWEERNKDYLEAFKEMGHETLLDTNGCSQLGYGEFQFVIDRRIRQSSAVSYLRGMPKSKNLHVLKNTLAIQIVMKKKRAVGVKFKLPCGKEMTAMAKKEVILCGGTINTPKLLMLSGIGPEKYLKKVNITTIVDSPNVGQNLIDHPMVVVTLTARRDAYSFVKNVDFMTNFDRLPLPNFVGRASLAKHKKQPCYQVNAFPLALGSIFQSLFCTHVFRMHDDICVATTKSGYTAETLYAGIALLHPLSRGKVLLRSNNYKDTPLIYDGLYLNEKDLELHARAVEDYVSVINSTYFRRARGTIVDYGIDECNKYRFPSHEYWKCHIRNIATTMYDYSGTCAMGPKGVVDERLKVRGAKSLRIIDASVIPTPVSGNIAATVLMVGEKGADMVKEDYDMKVEKTENGNEECCKCTN